MSADLVKYHEAAITTLSPDRSTPIISKEHETVNDHTCIIDSKSILKR